MTKSTHCGYAASLGLESALLAARGFTGDTAAFDGPHGYVEAFLPPHFDREMLLSFGPPFRLSHPSGIRVGLRKEGCRHLPWRRKEP